jgi:hypothetical protein
MIITKVSEKTLKDLQVIRKIIELEEDKNVTLDQVLSRVMNFYRRAVNY